jgi:hypothetical protein
MGKRRLLVSMGLLSVTVGCSDDGSRALMAPSAVTSLAAAPGSSVTVALQCGSNVTDGQITSLTIRDATGAILASSAGPSCEAQQKITGLAAKPASYEATIHVERFVDGGGGTADCPAIGTIPDRSPCVAPGLPGQTMRSLTGTLSIR